VVVGNAPDVSEVYYASTFRVAESTLYRQTVTHQPTHFDPENGDSIYLRNIGNIAHSHRK
jgi:hypothetical protein